MKTKTLIALSAGVLLLVAATAGATVYISDRQDENKAEETSSAQKSTKTSVVYNQSQQAPQAAPLPPCDDDNIVGKVVGGAAGGVVGSQFGKGNGKTATTIGGTVGGVLLGEEYIPTKNVTCR